MPAWPLHSAVFLSHSKAAGHAENRRLCLFIPSVVAEREHRTQHQGGNTRCGSTNKTYAALIPAQAAFLRRWNRITTNALARFPPPARQVSCLPQ